MRAHVFVVWVLLGGIVTPLEAQTVRFRIEVRSQSITESPGSDDVQQALVDSVLGRSAAGTRATTARPASPPFEQRTQAVVTAQRVDSAGAVIWLVTIDTVAVRMVSRSSDQGMGLQQGRMGEVVRLRETGGRIPQAEVDRFRDDGQIGWIIEQLQLALAHRLAPQDSERSGTRVRTSRAPFGLFSEAKTVTVTPDRVSGDSVYFGWQTHWASSAAIDISVRLERATGVRLYDQDGWCLRISVRVERYELKDEATAHTKLSRVIEERDIVRLPLR